METTDSTAADTTVPVNVDPGEEITPEPCFIPTDFVKPVLEKENDQGQKMKMRKEVYPIMAAGIQCLAEDVLKCALELTKNDGRTVVTAEDIDASTARAMFNY